MSAEVFGYVLMGVLVLERLCEVALAQRNEAWMRSQGAVEYGASFSRVLFLFHVLWFLSFLIEARLRPAVLLIPGEGVILAFFVLQGLRYWCIGSLGRFWNTKILVLPGAQLVRRGPYRWIKHPNYVVVFIEIALYPVFFGCWITALCFGLGNLFILRTRIRQENEALRTISLFNRIE